MRNSNKLKPKTDINDLTVESKHPNDMTKHVVASVKSTDSVLP